MSNVSPAFFADLNIPPIIRFMTWMFYAKYINILSLAQSIGASVERVVTSGSLIDKVDTETISISINKYVTILLSSIDGIGHNIDLQPFNILPQMLKEILTTTVYGGIKTMQEVFANIGQPYLISNITKDVTSITVNRVIGGPKDVLKMEIDYYIPPTVGGNREFGIQAMKYWKQG